MPKYIATKTVNYKGYKLKKSKLVPNYLVPELLSKGLCKQHSN